MWNEVITMYRDYGGTGMMLILFIIALVYLCITEGRRDVRMLILYPSLAILVLFICPLIAWAMDSIFSGEEVYYRLLWLVPMGLMIAYAGTKLAMQYKKNCVVIAALIIMFCGRLVYSNALYEKAENQYHLPEAVPKICDLIEVEGREVRAVFSAELIPYVRQYSATVVMPYGRELTVERWGNTDTLYEAMEADVVDMKKVAELAKERECHYIIMSENRVWDGDLEDYGYNCIGEADGYKIYLDPEADLSLWE